MLQRQEMTDLNCMSPAIQRMVRGSAEKTALSVQFEHSEPDEPVSINPRYAAALHNAPGIRLGEEHWLASLGDAWSL